MPVADLADAATAIASQRLKLAIDRTNPTDQATPIYLYGGYDYFLSARF